MKNKEVCEFCNKGILRYPAKTKTYFCNTKCKSDWQTLQREKLGFTYTHEHGARLRNISNPLLIVLYVIYAKQWK